MDSSFEAIDGRYRAALGAYLRERNEASLYQASLLGREYVELGIGPDDITALHSEALVDSLTSLGPRETVAAASDGLQFLLDVMIAYGVHHQRYLDLRLRQAESEAQLARERAADAERVEQERTDLLRAVAHELRTPLTVVKGALELIQRALTANTPDRLPGLMGQARDATERLVHLSTIVGQVGRGEALQVEIADLDLAALADRSCAWARLSAAEKGITLDDAIALAPVMVEGDAEALVTVVDNLLSNALHYTPAGGRIAVRCGTEDHGRRVWLSVTDTGIGMSEDVRRQIFDKFYRAPQARLRVVRGFGLGLYLVQRVVMAHNGWVEVESTPGVGSAFRVVLPRAADIAGDMTHGGDAATASGRRGGGAAGGGD